MRWLLSCLLIVVIAPSLVGAEQQEESLENPNGLGFAYLKLPDGILGVRYVSKRVYVGDSPQFYTRFINVRKIDAGGRDHLPVEGFLEVNDRPAKIEFVASDASVVKIERHAQLGDVFTFLGPGDVKVELKVGGELIGVMPIEVLSAPVTEGDTSEHVIETLGLPSERRRVYVRWPETKEIDRIVYRPRAGQSSSAEHWRWNEYPGLVVAISSGKVSHLRTAPVRPARPFAEELKIWLEWLDAQEKKAEDGLDND